MNVVRTAQAVALVVSVIVPLSACGGGDADSSSPRERQTRSIAGYGLSLEVPVGWEGRVVRAAPRSAPELIAGNFALPGSEDFLGPETRKQMRSRSLYVWIADLGSDRSHLQPGRWTEASVPINVASGDLTPFEGVDSPSEAVRWLVIDGKAILTIVGFGTETPTADLFAEANRILGSFEIAPSDS